MRYPITVIAIVSVVALVWYFAANSTGLAAPAHKTASSTSSGLSAPNRNPDAVPVPTSEGDQASHSSASLTSSAQTLAASAPPTASPAPTSAVPSTSSTASSTASKSSDPAPYGVMPPVPVVAQSPAALVAESLKTGTHPERLSALVEPPPFDRQRWLSGDAAFIATYLQESQPGRVFQPAQPGAAVPKLRFASAPGVVIAQGATCGLSVEAPVGAPVSFAVMDGGVFGNQLAAQTVRAGDDGRAMVLYTATAGVIEDVSILAASPLASGQLRFRIHVTDPGHPSPFAATKTNPSQPSTAP